MSESQQTKPRLWTIEDLAAYLSVRRGWVYDRTREGGPELIPHTKLGKYLRFNPNSPAFQEWLKSHEVETVDMKTV